MWVKGRIGTRNNLDSNTFRNFPGFIFSPFFSMASSLLKGSGLLFQQRCDLSGILE